jgi:nicotinate-nucleotide pyrophosphorylase (carboxylating)
LATIPKDTDAEATFIAKENGVIAGISLAEMIFNQVDPSLQVRYSLILLIFFGLIVLYYGG